MILSVGLIPENEIAESMQIQIDPKTKGPVCDSSAMTSVPGVFSCGNAYHVNDLVDYVSESGELAGTSAAEYAKEQKVGIVQIPTEAAEETAYVVPQCVRQEDLQKKVTFYFRCKRTMGESELTIRSGSRIIFQKHFLAVRPPEMERIVVDFSKAEEIREPIVFELREVQA